MQCGTQTCTTTTDTTRRLAFLSRTATTATVIRQRTRNVVGYAITTFATISTTGSCDPITTNLRCTTATTGTGIYGQATAATGTTYGVYGASASTTGFGRPSGPAGGARTIRR